MGQKVPLSDLFKIGSSKRVLKSQWQKSGVPFYRGREITKLSQDGVVDNNLFITEELYAEYSAKYGVPSTDDIVITAIGTIGNSYIVRDEDRFYFKDASVLWLKRTSDVESKYINLWLKSSLMRDQLDEGNGATVDTLTIKKLQGLTLDLPPIHEQKRIVSILDTVFADLEQTRAKTEQNLKNARELFDSKKLSLFESLSNSSNLSPLPSVCDNILAGGDAPKKGLYSKEQTEKFNIPIYANAVKHNGLYGYTDYARANEPSITIAARGSGTGHIELRTEPFLPIVRLIVLTPNKEIISLEYLKHALQTLDILRSGSAIPQLTVPMVKEYSIPVPDLNVQRSTVIELENLALYIERIEAIYQEKLIAIDELKKSILQKAFSGELTQTVE
ncbi:restriction endonuclease subunit S [Marinomonas primoryensis]|uniref:Restriction endonuclease subunit S n=1 Tax=Marinomonas primoryensis TaxID=178399 RepID=A0ABV0L423_9GAMM